MAGTYLRPTVIEEALQALDRGGLTIVSGGTDFYPAQVGLSLDDNVLDISAITGLRGIEEREDCFCIGATTTWTDLIRANLPPLFDGLKAAAREVGGAQVQNAGTICGNICNASPAADGVPPLLALDADVALASANEARQLPLGDFISGNRRTARATNELVTGLVVPKPARPARSTFRKLGTRRYLVISIVMASAVIEPSTDGTVAAARVAVGACSEVACRLPALEAVLAGRPLGPGLADAVTADHLAPLAPIDDIRASAGYRREAALVLVRRLLRDLEDGWEDGR